MRLGLIPVGDGEEVVGPVIPVPVLDRRAQRLGERNRRIEVESINGGSRAGALVAFHRRAEQAVRKRVLPEIPRAEEIIFRSGADDRRCRLTVDEEHVVSLAPPEVLILQDRHRDAGEMAAAGGLHPDVVVFTLQVLSAVDRRLAVRLPVAGPSFRRRGLPVLRVEVQRAGRERLLIHAAVDVEVERAHARLPFVRHRDARLPLERHRKEAVQRTVGSNRERVRRVQEIIAEPQSEKVADRRLHARRGLVVPVHAQHELLQVKRLRARDGDPDVADDAGAGLVRERQRLSGRDRPHVGVSARLIEAGDPLEDVVLRLREVRQHRVRRLRGGDAAEQTQR